MLLPLLLCALCLTQGIVGIPAPAQIGVAAKLPTLWNYGKVAAPIDPPRFNFHYDLGKRRAPLRRRSHGKK